MLQIQNDYESWKKERKRQIGPEVDFGAWWTLHGDENEHPRWRVTWLSNTSELFAVQLHSQRYIPLGIFASRQDVEQAMDGWADPDSPIYHNLTALAEKLGAA